MQSLPSWQRDQCTQIITLIRKSSNEITESIKWKNPYFDLDGAFIKFFCAKEWVNVYFYKGYLLPDPVNLLEKTDNAKMRTLRLYPNKELSITAVEKLIASAVQNQYS